MPTNRTPVAAQGGINGMERRKLLEETPVCLHDSDRTTRCCAAGQRTVVVGRLVTCLLYLFKPVVWYGLLFPGSVSRTRLSRLICIISGSQLQYPLPHNQACDVPSILAFDLPCPSSVLITDSFTHHAGSGDALGRVFFGKSGQSVVCHCAAKK